MLEKLERLKQEDESVEKRKNFMMTQLQPPSMYERSRAKIEKLNEEGRLAR